jgi:predicted ATP-dependent endonuclease of OLD family
MTNPTVVAASAGAITLRCLELNRFRRLANVQVDVDEKTTILVGANNSGKTSVLAALRHFLSDTFAFGAYDISLSQWGLLRELGRKWETLAENPTSAAAPAFDWNDQLVTLRATMPTLDLWFNAEAGMYHVVAPFLSRFSWKGGAVGLRLRLEPASDVEGLRELAWAYNQARAPVKDMGEKSLAWPIDLIDFWLHEPRRLGVVRVYKLDADNNPLEGKASYSPEILDAEAVPIDRKQLAKLIRVDFVAAQRGLGSEEAESRSASGPHRAGLFSNQLLKFARDHLKVASTGHGHRADLIQAVAEAQTALDEKIEKAIAPSVAEVRELGYPGLHDPQEIRFRTRIQAADLLDHSTAVQYGIDKGGAGDFLPEFSIGLGYQNLQSLSYQLVSFKTARLNPEKGSPAPVHFVMLEEPEAHLHVQVQRIFAAKAHKLISPTLEEGAGLKSQLLISTHSSHLAHAENFDRLRYVRRVPKSAATAMPTTEVVNLGSVFGGDVQTRKFAERYFRVQHTDLLFANAAIFVEGVAERMLVPLFIERYFEELSTKYVSFLDVGGSHAHRLKPLVEKLRIPTVIITDVDPVEVKKSDKNPKTTVRVAVANLGQAGLECGNATLRKWHPKRQKMEDLKAPTDDALVWAEAGCAVRFAWQLPVVEADGSWPSSFEDSLVLTNHKWFAAAAAAGPAAAAADAIELPTGGVTVVAELVAQGKPFPELVEMLHALMHKSLDKGEFAATIFELVANGAPIVCPKYIADALQWLQDQLQPNPELTA